MNSEEYSSNNRSIRKTSGIAKERWKLLAQILQNGEKSYENNIKSSVSIRRFQSFGLFDVKTVSADKDVLWQDYSLSQHSTQFQLSVSELKCKIDADKLQGFNNTGNICIWPAEEIMAYYCLVNKHLFHKKNVIELGGGMTCLAGFTIAATSEASLVQVTDGNEDSVKNLSAMVDRNQQRFHTTEVISSLFRWGPGPLEDCLQEKFDIVLCSDCLFFEEGRKDLVNSMFNLLKPQGVILVFAPSRGGTFDMFKCLAEESFDTEVIENYNPTVWSLHQKIIRPNVE
ncbi:hypothetical protein LOTGIDRAFT_166823 [Lottia gigantea]|uniref:Calmodulin-lysine N-methyltransferase n=1 Tax=Lottia gigantea TaxID=225164 RepID=V3ZW34_LOTGI|nr:hypothetical protein LOTGIDRAFT_166823 [Lottia gigantea]ESO86820.1 hypothetical protein LOTGIDRAFT_166823 [Lottia gigantea]